VLRAATLNVVRHYGINAGLLGEGDPADFILVDDPHEMNVLETWIDGRQVFDGQRACFNPGEVIKINKFNCTRLVPDDIRVVNRGGGIRVINARNGELLTGSGTASAGNDPYVVSRPDEDILKIVLKERYNDARPVMGFIRGFGLKTGAIATSVAHDSHNLLAVGVNDRDIVKALNMVTDAEGGMAVVSENEEQIVKLAVAGIMSDMPVTAMASRYERLTEMSRSLGCRMDAPFMTLSFMALLVIPELKISDNGLFDGIAFKHVSLFL
jgi:adenine deaminase